MTLARKSVIGLLIGITAFIGIGVYYYGRAFGGLESEYEMEALTRVATHVEQFRTDEGRYPIAKTAQELNAILGKRHPELDAGTISYFSDGSGYILRWGLVGERYYLEIRDGQWVSWPEIVRRKSVAEFDRALNEVRRAPPKPSPRQTPDGTAGR